MWFVCWALVSLESFQWGNDPGRHEQEGSFLDSHAEATRSLSWIERILPSELMALTRMVLRVRRHTYGLTCVSVSLHRPTQYFATGQLDRPDFHA